MDKVLRVYCTRTAPCGSFLLGATHLIMRPAPSAKLRPGSGNNNNRVELLGVRLECFLSLDHTARLFLITFNDALAGNIHLYLASWEWTVGGQAHRTGACVNVREGPLMNHSGGLNEWFRCGFGTWRFIIRRERALEPTRNAPSQWDPVAHRSNWLFLRVHLWKVTRRLAFSG